MPSIQIMHWSNKLTICLSAVVVQVALIFCQSSVTKQPDADYTNVGHTSQPHISDHRFFLHEIFTKYGHDGQMTFEGFEHLLESLGLGNIIITDHDVTSHKQNAFLNTHDTHDHSKKTDASEHAGRRGTKDHNHDAEHGVSATPDPRSHDHSSHSHLPRKSSTLKYSQNTFTQRQPSEDSNFISTDVHLQESTPSSRMEHHQNGNLLSEGQMQNRSDKSTAENMYRYHLREGEIPELLVNISSLVDQHQELENKAPEIVIEQCLSPKEILETFGINQTSNLNPVSFLHLCPAIIYELDQGHCLFRDHSHKKQLNIVTINQWIYSCLAVLAISLCGLFSVAVIPIMQKWFYHTLLQFLVGLAVGSLSGDALLHLMPHAMLGGEGDHDHSSAISAESAERTAVWRGFAALGGIFFFFIAERLLGAFSLYRKKRKSKTLKQINITGDSSTMEDYSFNGNVGEKLSQYRKNSYDFMPTEKEMMRMLQTEKSLPNSKSTHSAHELGYPDPPNSKLQQREGDIENANTMPEHHGHGHGHSHEVPQSVTAVAWMVIMGDGLHNFCDGLAIGAAFASGIEGGISTTVAVFCHELPHELGDFAMLLKTGMKVKQALFYNGLSSVLCFIGLIIGVSLGNVNSATSWVFAGTAGMFLYIALVDMLPELSTNDPSSTPTYQLAVQMLGISTGVSIMLLIANYEQDLQAMIS